LLLLITVCSLKAQNTMTRPAEDEPEIVLGAPSAPPATASLTGLPTATAFATPAVATPVGRPIENNSTTAGGKIERTSNADGSLHVKITTTTTQPNGYREVKIEYFRIPANMAGSVNMQLNAGDAPSNLYMTKMEQQTLPPGTGEVVSRPPSAYPTSNQATAGTGQAHNEQAVYQGGSSSDESRKICAICVGMCCLVFIILGIVGAANEGATRSADNWTPNWEPSYYPPPSPYWTPYPVYTPSYYHTPRPVPSYPTVSPRPSTTRPTNWWDKKDPWTMWTQTPTVSPRPTVSPDPTYSPTITRPPFSWPPFLGPRPAGWPGSSPSIEERGRTIERSVPTVTDLSDWNNSESAKDKSEKQAISSHKQHNHDVRDADNSNIAHEETGNEAKMTK